MTIKKKKAGKKIVIDTTGPEGNAFYILGVAQSLSKQNVQKSGRPFSEVYSDLTSGDYEHLIKVFDDEFGHVVDILR